VNPRQAIANLREFYALATAPITGAGHEVVRQSIGRLEDLVRESEGNNCDKCENPAKANAEAPTPERKKPGPKPKSAQNPADPVSETLPSAPPEKGTAANVGDL